MKAEYIKRDSNGDAFSKKYGKYIGGNLIFVNDTLEQLETNYENCFDEIPTKEDMEKAISFISLFMAEIGETCSNTSKSHCAMGISELLDEDVIKTVENIVEYRNT